MHNNVWRMRIGKQPLAKQVFPGVTAVGGVPVFYLIPITQPGHTNPPLTGAAYTIWYRGAEVKTGKASLGKKAGVYDAEMYALAGASSTLTRLLEIYPQLRQIHFFTDNSAAIASIADTTAHAAQEAAIIFRGHVDDVLGHKHNLQIKLHWVPGHAGIMGNERADQLAKEAVSAGEPLLHSTLSWAKERSKKVSASTWRREWATERRTGQAAVALRRPPRLSISPFFDKTELTRDQTSRLIQAMTGHGFIGEYYARFVRTEPTECPCGAEPQTRRHILADCPRHDAHRHILRGASRSLSLPILLGTPKGLEAVAEFIRASGAFKKTPRNIVLPDDPPEPH